MKCFFLYGSNNSDSVVFGNDGFGEMKDHSLRTAPFQKTSCYGSFRYDPILRKKVFSGAPVKYFFFMARITQILLFLGMTVLERSNMTVFERRVLENIFCYGSFRYMSTLRKKVFSGAPVKHDFLYGSNKSASVLFGNAGFGEIKDHSLRLTPVQRHFW